jgi:hypothetical protein
VTAQNNRKILIFLDVPLNLVRENSMVNSPKQLKYLVLKPDFESFRYDTCELDIIQNWSCNFLVSVTPHQQDVYVVFITELSACDTVSCRLQ